jgi:hypothetical protein
VPALSRILREEESWSPRPEWLPPGKTAAVCFSIDDVHPGTSKDSYEAGGDLSAGALGRLQQLQRRHPKLKATLCVTPDWRLGSLTPEGAWLRQIPWVDRGVHWARSRGSGRFRLDRHPQLVDYLNELERCEVVLHGLMHSHDGPQFAVEFQDESEEQCLDVIQRGLTIFKRARLKFVAGYAPPGWNAPASLIGALNRMNFQFLTAARDVHSAIEPGAVTAMSGLQGVSLLYPQFVGPGPLVHLSCNFQATSSFERAEEIVQLGGVLHVKAHIFKSAGRHVMLDGLDDLYCNYLDLLFTYLTKRFGEHLWWAHLSEVAHRMRMSI